MASELGSASAPSIYRLGPPPQALAAYSTDDAGLATELLAEAVVLSEAWPGGAANLVLAGRRAPVPLLVAIGAIGSDERARLDGLAVFLHGVVPLATFWTWRDVEDACADLARDLRVRLGARVSDALLVGIPRGGLVVAATLAYLMGVHSSRVRAASASAIQDWQGPLILVDDVVVSGARLIQTARAARTGEGWLAAVLASPPAAAAAVRATEGGPDDVVFARPLRDLSESVHGSDVAGWRTRWRASSPEAAAWIGVTEHPIFPWSEPDVTIRNPSTGDVDVGWSAAPPGASLAARGRRERREGGSENRLQWTPPGEGPMRSGSTVVDVRLEGRRLLVDVESGRHVALDEAAGLVWDAVLAAESDVLGSAARALATAFDVSEQDARDDAEAFVAGMLQAGLLVQAEGA